MTALFQELAQLWRLRALLRVLTRREVHARYQGSAAGVAWAYVQPLLTGAAYYLVFDIVFGMRLAQGAPTGRVGTYLIVGSLPWMAFCDAVGRGTSSLLDAGGLLQKNALPPALFPLRAVAASALVYGPLLALLVLAYAPLHRFAPALLAVVPLLALMLLLTALLAWRWPSWRRRCATWCRWWVSRWRSVFFSRRCCFPSRSFPPPGAGCCGATR